jgi:hypothetical protein
MMRGGLAVLERAAASPSFSAGTMGKAEQKRTGGEAKAKTGAEQEDGAVDGAFDLWLKRGLHQLYDTVAKEPIPEDLLRMIQDDLAKKDE